jgi:hypothetical protein
VCDLSTDEGARRAYARATGEAAPRDLCVDRSRTFGIVRLGGLVHDLGCSYTITMYECRVDDPTTPARAMIAAGWPTADDAAKRRLALAWVSEIGGARVLTDEPATFAAAGKTFTPPSGEPLPDGGVRVLYWVERPAGMTPEVRYVQVETAFDGRGVVVSQRELDRFEARP